MVNAVADLLSVWSNGWKSPPSKKDKKRNALEQIVWTGFFQ